MKRVGRYKTVCSRGEAGQEECPWTFLLPNGVAMVGNPRSCKRSRNAQRCKLQPSVQGSYSPRVLYRSARFMPGVIENLPKSEATGVRTEDWESGNKNQNSVSLIPVFWPGLTVNGGFCAIATHGVV